MPIRIVIVEDDPKFLEGVTLLFANLPSMKIVGKYTTGKEAIEGILEKKPDVALIDLGLPDIPGMEIIKAVLEKECETELLALTIYDDDEHLFQALKAGAVGYIVKNETSLSEVVRAIEEAVNGGAPMSLSIARRILNEFRKNKIKDKNPALESLTARELEILEHLAKGFSAKKVADSLYISHEAVRSHQKNIYRKLRVHSAVEAVAVFRG